MLKDDGIIIRTARESDVDHMIPLLEALTRIEVDFRFDEAKQRAGLGLLLKSDKDFVAVAQVRGGKVVGMCAVQTLISTAEGGRVGLVEDLVVDPTYRGRDVGGQLLHAAEDWAAQQGLKRLQLLADKENTPALGFYLRRGWTLTRMICLRKRDL